MINEFNTTEKEILEALNRSGYMLESEITKQLADLGFFVESNQTTLDPLTGKSREIDLLAEFYEYDREKTDNKIVASTRFVFEIKNNTFPFVLLTKMEFSPNIEIWDALKIVSTIPEGVDFSVYSGFYELLIGKNNKELFTQYCSFSKKKANEELMALHPENIYAGLSKITHFCEEVLENRVRERTDRHIEEYLRNFLYLPVLLIKEDLYELEISQSGTRLKKVECSRLIFNYHYRQEPKSSIVYIVTKEGLSDFIKEFLRVEKMVEENMLKAKNVSKR